MAISGSQEVDKGLEVNGVGAVDESVGDDVEDDVDEDAEGDVVAQMTCLTGNLKSLSSTCSQ